MEARERILLSIIVIILAASLAYAEPYGPTSVDAMGSSRRTSFGSGSQTVNAEAGNVTALVISSFTVTKRWQGYYGNITGSITLDNSEGWTMYDWAGITSPEGEVYAANGTVSSWGKVRCINLTPEWKGYNCTGTNDTCLNVSQIESWYGMGALDSDGVNETFNSTLASLQVGTETVTGCPMTHIYTNGTIETPPTWNETLLTINNTATIIYTSIINPGYGFNNKSTHFQMIVGENGDDSATTTYQFYVELA